MKVGDRLACKQEILETTISLNSNYHLNSQLNRKLKLDKINQKF